MRTTARLVVPLILLVSIALFIQGHNMPGGGFIGGVLTATAFALIYVTYGIAFLEEEILNRSVKTVVEHLRHGVVADYRRLFAFGLLVAAAGGLFPVVLGFEPVASLFGERVEAYAAGGLPFLEQGYVILHHVPLYGELELASAVVFDFGVYCVVVGSLLTILSVVGAE